MNKLDEAFQKVSDRIGSEWRNHGWRKMTNEEVDADVQKALCIIEELVDRNKVLEAKATPKKPIKKTFEYENMNEEILIKTYYVCGCEKFSEVHHIDRFCSKCGQAIDWREDEN